MTFRRRICHIDERIGQSIAAYSQSWHSKPEAYHFATGSVKDRLAVCRPVCKSLSALSWKEHRQSWGLASRQTISFRVWCLTIRSARCLSADHGVACLGINLGTTTTLRDTQADAQLNANFYADSFVIQPQSTVRDRYSDKSHVVCGATAARYLAICVDSTKDASIRERSAWNPGLFQKDCLLGIGTVGLEEGGVKWGI